MTPNIITIIKTANCLKCLLNYTREANRSNEKGDTR